METLQNRGLLLSRRFWELNRRSKLNPNDKPFMVTVAKKPEESRFHNPINQHHMNWMVAMKLLSCWIDEGGCGSGGLPNNRMIEHRGVDPQSRQTQE
ncbi:Os04g0109450 [Oryza sativa Japonica Group]|uniref:Os04g0109450 protein n=1 Tax=Oryza sativa subsp. japonica TaxID=39947 RepID=A0A0P0W6N4_ORYSJ|nr:Os04g0109450 [Oryza sativa Japonica Group]